MSIFFNILSGVMLLIGLKKRALYSLIAGIFIFVSIGLHIIENSQDLFMINVLTLLIKTLSLFLIGVIYGIKKMKEILMDRGGAKYNKESILYSQEKNIADNSHICIVTKLPLVELNSTYNIPAISHQDFSSIHKSVDHSVVTENGSVSSASNDMVSRQHLCSSIGINELMTYLNDEDIFKCGLHTDPSGNLYFTDEQLRAVAACCISTRKLILDFPSTTNPN